MAGQSTMIAMEGKGFNANVMSAKTITGHEL